MAAGSADLAAIAIERPVGRSAHRLRLDASAPPERLQALQAELRMLPGIEQVELDVLEQAQAAVPLPGPVPSDPMFARQTWLISPTSGTAGLPDIAGAWRRSTGMPIAGGSFVPVAVLDTGIRAEHPDLADRFLPGYDFVSRVANANDGDGRDPDPSDPGDWITPADAATAAFQGCTVSDSSWHGTRIAGQIAAATNNGVGVAGIDWEGRIVPVRIAGRCGALLSDVIDAMRWAAGLTVLDANGEALPANPNPVRIINLSYGSNQACGSVMQQTIDELSAMGVVVVAAAGNGRGSVSRPANCRGVVAVTSLSATGLKASYAGFGPEVTIATMGGDMAANGACGASLHDDGVFTTTLTAPKQPDGGVPDYAPMEGTSFAAPVVAGTLALMLAINPGLSYDELVQGLRVSARRHVLAARMGDCTETNNGRCACTTATCGAGVLDTAQALAYAADPGSYVASTTAAAAVPDEMLQACATGDSSNAIGLSAQDVTSTATAEGGGWIDVGTLAILALACLALLANRRYAKAARQPSRSGPNSRLDA